jgi:hypothetical protein
MRSSNSSELRKANSDNLSGKAVETLHQLFSNQILYKRKDQSSQSPFLPSIEEKWRREHYSKPTPSCGYI